MSNDEFDDLFGDDPFGDDDFDSDDDFGFDDDPFSDSASAFDDDGDDFAFDDDDEFGGFDENFEDDFDLADDLDEDFLTEEDEGDGGGPNRTFVILAAMMIFLFIIGLGVVIFLALNGGEDGPDSFDMTASAIADFNSTQIAFLGATQTQQITNVAGTQTQAAEDELATQTAIVVATDDAIASATAEAALATQNALATADAEEAANAQATADAAATFEFLTAQAQPAETEVPVETEETPDAIDVDSVAQTATRIAELINQGTPTPQEGGTGGQATRTPSTPSTLPDTGIFDDATGGQSVGAMLLIAFGLVGVMFGARRLRVMNNNAAEKEQKS